MPVSVPSDFGLELNEAKSKLETPVLAVDVAVMEENVHEFVEFAEHQNVRLRSHAKSHKIPELANWQHSITNGGIVCQKLSEAEVMAANGINDIYLSNIVVDKSKLLRLVRLSNRLEYFATTVDGIDSVKLLNEVAARQDATVNVILEVDVGLNRLGVAPGQPAVELANAIRSQTNLTLDGVMGYEGHIGYGETPPKTETEYKRRCFEVIDILGETVELIEEEGILVDDVMAGSTATAMYSGKHPSVTEIHPGMYPFNDVRLRHRVPSVEKENCAVTVLGTVISTPAPNRAIVDIGSKSLSLDIDYMPEPKYRDDIRYYRASEEHGWIDTSNATDSISVGDQLEFIVPHVCTTINLHDVLVGTREEYVTDIWDIEARGKVK